MMAEESIGKNFIEQIIDKDIAEGGQGNEGSHKISSGTEWIFAYRTCQIHIIELWSCTGIWRTV